MATDLKIAYLREHQSLIFTIEAHFIREWNGYYGPGGPGDALADIGSMCNTLVLPIGLVALRKERFAGIVVLREKTDSHRDLTPWVTSFYVVPEHRRQGVGIQLVNAVEHLAAKLGFKRIYARSATAVAFFENQNWVPFDMLGHHTEQLTIFLKDLRIYPSEPLSKAPILSGTH